MTGAEKPIFMMGQGSLTGGFLEHLKITEKNTNFAICRTLRKFTEHLPNNFRKPQKLSKTYRKHTTFGDFHVFFRNFRLMFADFENSEFGNFLLIFR